MGSGTLIATPNMKFEDMTPACAHGRGSVFGSNRNLIKPPTFKAPQSRDHEGAELDMIRSRLSISRVSRSLTRANAFRLMGRLALRNVFDRNEARARCGVMASSFMFGPAIHAER